MARVIGIEVPVERSSDGPPEWVLIPVNQGLQWPRIPLDKIVEITQPETLIISEEGAN